MKKFYLLMMFALLGMVANAAEVVTTSTFKSGLKGDYPAGQVIPSDQLTWTVDKAIYIDWDTNNGKGVQFGSKSSPAKDVTLQTAETFANVRKIEAYLSVATDGNASVSAFVGETQMGVTTDFSNKDLKVYTFEGGPVSGNISFVLNSNVKKALYVQKVVIYSEEADPTQVATPTFSVEAGEIYSDTEIAINCATEGATIKYTLDEDPTVFDYSTPLVFTEIGKTVTVTAWAEAEGLDASEKAVVTYNVVEKPATIKFTKVEDLSLLSTNDRVIIVCEDYNSAMSTTVSSNKIEPAEVSIDNGVVNLPVNSTAAIFSVTSLGENTFTFNSSVGYLYSNTKDKTNLYYNASSTNRTSFIASNDGNGILLTIGSEDRSVLYSSSSDAFGYYSKSNIGGSYYVVSLYKEIVDENQVAAPTFSLTSGTYFKTQELSLSCETEGAKVFYTIDNGEGVSEDREYLEPIQLTNGIYEINAWATKDGFKTSSTVSAIYEIKVIPFEEINVENVKEGKYIIAYNDVETGKSYIMKNEVISDYYVGAMEFDLTTDTPAETELFVVKQTEGGYTIQNSGNTYVALIQSGKFTNLKPQETDPFVWNFAKSENGNIVATGQGIDSYMSFKMYNTTPEFLAEKNGNYPMFYFVSGTSSVNDAVANEFKAVAVANGIEVNVAEAGLVSVYNAAGQLVANVNVAEGTTTINVAGGFYIIKAGNNVAKVLVK